MGRKKKHEEHENLERWLVSYADFITLLFATFVVLYALSQLDLAKFKDLKVSLQQAFSPTIFAGQGSDSQMMDKSGEKILNESKLGDDVNILPPINPNLQEKKEQKVKEEIEKAVNEGKVKGIEVKADKRGLVVSLLDNVFFDSGSSYVRAEALKTLDQVALIIKKNFPHNDIRIEGHTDSQAISSGAFPSNWELSAARSSSVVRHFIMRFKMDKRLFSAVGYADSRPIAPNNTNDGRKKNRRVEIVILNSDSASEEAAKTSELPGTTSESKKEAPKKDDTIQIIKGSRGQMSTLKNSLEEKTQKPEEQTEQYQGQPQGETSVNVGNSHSPPANAANQSADNGHINPIEMPVKTGTQRVVGIETKVLDGKEAPEEGH